MAAPEYRYATTLAVSLSAGTDSIVVTSLNNLQGDDGTNDPASALVNAVTGLRLLKPGTPTDSTVATSYTAEVVEVADTPVDNLDGTHTIAITRQVANFGGGAKSKDTGVYEQQPDGSIDIDADATGEYAFIAGSVVENLNADALLLAVSTGAEEDDYVENYDNGSVRFLNIGATTATERQLATGMTVSAFFEYAAASSQRVNLGEKLPNVEFVTEFQHSMPDNRYFKGYFHKGSITPDNAEFSFDPTDWVGSVLPIDLLKSPDAAHVANPIGWLDVENDPITLQAPVDPTDSYTVGVYELFLTPLNTTLALQKGLPVTRFSIGNVRIGTFTSPQEFLEHFVGIPQDLDKKIRIKRQYRLETTFEEIRAVNLGLLFDGRVENITAGYLPANTLITLAASPQVADPTSPYTLEHVWHSLRYLLINPE